MLFCYSTDKEKIMLIVISGVSGSGKNTVIEKLMKKKKNLKIFSSAITRAPREGEHEKGFYIFLTKQEFEEKIKNNEFFEFELVHGTYRGILKNELEKVEKDNCNNYIRDIDVKGNRKLRKYFSKGQIISIFLEVDDDELRNRLKKRGESDEEINLRLSRAPLEREYKSDYDYIIENKDLEETVNKISDIIDKKAK